MLEDTTTSANHYRPGCFREPVHCPGGELAEVVDGVWLTERGYERFQSPLDSFSRPPCTVTRNQKERYVAFERWASGCFLWLNWCFETVKLYRYERPEALYSSPFTLSW
jgi:hypothetical protein